MRRSVLDAIDGKGGTATFGEILGRLKMRKRPVMESLEALLEEGRVTRINTSLGFAYELR
jgi:DNA-binding IclR family transcriptional regulator